MAAVAAGAIVGAIGLTGAGAAIAQTVISGLITFALTYAQQALFGAKKPDGFTDVGTLKEGAKQTVRQAVPKRRTIYGRATVGGAITFIDKAPPNLVVQYALADHECDALESIFEQSIEVFLDSEGNATTTPFFDGVDVFLQINIRLGLADQPVDPLLKSLFPQISDNFRQRGTTVATARMFYGNDRDQHEEKWGNQANIHPKFRLRGKKIYDPRDASQAADDPTTWKWSDNAVLVVVDYLRSPDGGRKSSGDIDWAFTRVAADICDQQVLKKDGTTEKRYTINGVFDTSERPADVLGDMLDAMRGRIIWVNGKFRAVPGTVQAATMTISQDMLAGPFEYRASAPRDELVNVIRSKFVSPERSNQPADTPVLKRDDLIAEDGERLEVALEHPYVEDHTRSQRLDKAHLTQSRFGRLLSVTTDMRPLRLTAGELVNIEFKDFPYANGIYAVERISFINNFSQLTFTLKETSNEVYEWDPVVDEQDFELAEGMAA